jgi:hypothetical protein
VWYNCFDLKNFGEGKEMREMEEKKNSLIALAIFILAATLFVFFTGFGQSHQNDIIPPYMMRSQ